MNSLLSSLSRCFTLALAVGGLLLGASLHAQVTVTAENVPSTNSNFYQLNQFTTVPNLNPIGTPGTWSLISGSPAFSHGSGPLSVLNDGLAPTSFDDAAHNVFSDGTVTRFSFDLGSVASVTSITSYTAHISSGRTSQLYNVWAASSPSDLAPTGDPTTSGWTFLATVNTYNLTGIIYETGATAVNITSGSGSLGDFRYVMFQTFDGTFPDPAGTQSFLSEINIGASAIPEPSTYAAIAGATMLGFVMWRRRAGKGPVVAAV